MRKPRLFVFSGQPGSGKTSRARELSGKLHVPYFDYDTLVQPFLQGIERRQGIGDSRASFYKEWRDESYGTMWAPVLENLKLGNDAILSAPLTREVRTEDFFQRLKEDNALDVEVFAFYLAPDPETHFKMLVSRGSYRDEEVVADYEKYRRTHDATQPSWDPDHGFYVTFRSLEKAEEVIWDLVEPLLK